MPNIREQRIDANGIYIVASDGRSIELTVADIKRLTRGARSKAEGQLAIARAIENALGPEQVPARVRRVPMKPNPQFDRRVTDAGDVRSRETIPDEDNAYVEDTILIDYDAASGRPTHLGMRS